MVLSGLGTTWPIITGEMPKSSLFLSSAFLIAGTWVLSIAVRRPPVFGLSEGEFSHSTLRIPVSTVTRATVFRLAFDGGYGRYLSGAAI